MIETDARERLAQLRDAANERRSLVRSELNSDTHISISIDGLVADVNIFRQYVPGLNDWDYRVEWCSPVYGRSFQNLEDTLHVDLSNLSDDEVGELFERLHDRKYRVARAVFDQVVGAARERGMLHDAPERVDYMNIVGAEMGDLTIEHGRDGGYSLFWRPDDLQMLEPGEAAHEAVREDIGDLTSAQAISRIINGVTA